MDVDIARDMCNNQSVMDAGVQTEMAVYQKIFTGYLNALPHQESKVVKVFLSSTPTDMLVERHWLVMNAVPYLRRYSQDRGLEFQLVDLGWGVRLEMLSDTSVIDFCLNEILQCQRVSRGPNFVAFLGDMYGYRPLPTTIDLTEFKLLKNTAMKLGYDITPILTWYCRDDNVDPPVYVLQPVTSHYKYIQDFSAVNVALRHQDQREWLVTMEKIQQLFRGAAEHEFEEGKISKETKHSYFQSVLDKEVTRGILNAAETKNKVVCFSRTLIDIDLKADIAGRYTDMFEEGLDMNAEELRERLRLVKIPTVLGPDNLKKYLVPWSNYGLDTVNNLQHISYMHNLGQDFVSAMEKMITAGLTESPSIARNSPLFQEVVHHLHICDKLSKTFCGFEDVLDDIQSKISFFYGTEEEETMQQNLASFQESVKVPDVTHEERESPKREEDTETDTEGKVNEDQVDITSIRSASVKSQTTESTVDRLAQLGVRYVVGDAEDDMESDPDGITRDDLLALPVIRDYTKPLFVYGKHGSGKSTLMAKLMALSKTWFPESVSIIRFLGTSTMSSSIREVLTSLCLQIWIAYGVQKPTGVDLDGEFQSVVDYFMALLWKIDTKAKPLIILLDSLSKLSPSDHSYSLKWLPKQLPPNVHFILSMEKYKHNCLKNAQQIFPEPDQYIMLPEITMAMAADMVALLCYNAERQITRRQKILLMERFEKHPYPLYVKLLTNIASSWHSYTNVDKETLGHTLPKAAHFLFEKLEQKHGVVLVSKTLGYLCAAKNGLSELELEDILSLDDDVLKEVYVHHLPYDPEVIRVPQLLMRRLLHDIEAYLLENDSGGKKVLTWQNQQFADHAREKYVRAEVKVQLHQVLAEYFQGVWSKQWKPIEFTRGKRGNFTKAMRQVPEQPTHFTPGYFNVRKLSELPFHFIHAHKFNALVEVIFLDCDWLFSKCQAMSLTSLLEDYRLALDVMEANDLVVTNLVLFSRIRLIYKILYLGRDSIRKDSAYLPVQILAQLGLEYQGDDSLEKLVRRSLQWCKDSNLPLLYPIRACLNSPTGIMLCKIDLDLKLSEGDDRNVCSRCMCFHDSTSQLFVLLNGVKGNDKLCVFDMRNHGDLFTTENLNFEVCSIQFVGNNRYFLLKVLEKIGGADAVFRDKLYEISASSLVSLPSTASVITVSQSGRYIAYTTDSTVTVYLNDKTQKTVAIIPLGDSAPCVTGLLVSPDDKYLLIEDSSRTVRVFKIASQRRLHVYENCQFYTIAKRNFLVCMVSGDDDNIVILNLASGVFSSVLSKRKYDLFNLHSTYDYLLVGASPQCPKDPRRPPHAEIFDISTARMLGVCPIKGHYTQLVIFGEESIHYVVTVEQDSAIYIMFAGYVGKLLQNAVFVRSLKGHTGPIQQIIVSVKQDQIFSAADDHSIRVWDLRHVTEVFKSDLHLVRQSKGFTLDIEDIVSKYDWKEEEVVPVTQPTQVVLHDPTQRAFVGTKDGRLMQYSCDNGNLLSSVALGHGEITHMLVSQSKKHVILGCQNVVIWSVENGTWETVKPRKTPVSCMAESNNILVAGHAGTASLARVWNIKTGEVIRDIDLLYAFSCVAVNSLGTAVVSTLFDFPVIIQLSDDTDDGDVNLKKLDTMMSSGVCVVISPDDKLTASGSADGSVRVVKMNGTYLYRMQQKSAITALTFTPDSRSLLSSGFRSIYIWSTENGSLRYKMTRHLDFISAMQLDVTGRFLVTTSHDQQLILWDFKRGISIATFQTHCNVKVVEVSRKARAIAFLPEGIAKIGLIKPNRAQRKIMKGKFQSLSLNPTAQAVALSFSGQSHSSNTCALS